MCGGAGCPSGVVGAPAVVQGGGLLAVRCGGGPGVGLTVRGVKDGLQVGWLESMAALDLWLVQPLRRTAAGWQL